MSWLTIHTQSTCNQRWMCLLGGLGSGQSQKAVIPSWPVFFKQGVFIKAPIKSQKLWQAMNPDSAFWNLGVLKKPIPSTDWSGLQQAMRFQSCRERQCSAWQARRDMSINHLCRGERSLEKSRGAQRRNIKTETHLGDKSLKIYCHLIQQITTHSQIRNNRNLSSKQNKTKSNPPSILKPIFWPIPNHWFFTKTVYYWTQETHWLGFRIQKSQST